MLTSYYSVTPDATPGAICISRYMPRETNYAWCKQLMPGPWFRSAKTEQYIPLYHEILSKLDPQQIWDELHELAGGAEPILLCYESPGSFCHRRLAAKWLESSLGITIQEGRISKKTGERIVVEPWEVRKSFALPTVEQSTQLELL